MNFIQRIRLAYYRWRTRTIDPNTCCCGSELGKGGDICAHGGCRSAQEAAIEYAMEEAPWWSRKDTSGKQKVSEPEPGTRAALDIDYAKFQEGLRIDRQIIKGENG